MALPRFEPQFLSHFLRKAKTANPVYRKDVTAVETVADAGLDAAMFAKYPASKTK